MGDEETMYEVEGILDHRKKDGVDFYLVKWKGYTEQTWEPDANIGEELNDLKDSIRRRREASGVADNQPQGVDGAVEGKEKTKDKDTDVKKKTKDKEKGKEKGRDKDQEEKKKQKKSSESERSESEKV